MRHPTRQTDARYRSRDKTPARTQGALESEDAGGRSREAMKRTEAAVRQKAKTIGIGLGHRR
jgi:hypothetical protein